MTQEVQTTLDYKAELNLIEGVGYQERKISDKMQVRDKTSNGVVAVANGTFIRNDLGEVTVGGWATLTSMGNVVYTSSGDSIIIPEGGAYLLQYKNSENYPQTSYFYTIKVKADGVTLYSLRTYIGDREVKTAVVNLGKKNHVTMTLEAEYPTGTSQYPTLKLIKL